MIELICNPPLCASVGYTYARDDVGLRNAYGGGKIMQHVSGRVCKVYDNKHPFNILTEEIYD